MRKGGEGRRENHQSREEEREREKMRRKKSIEEERKQTEKYRTAVTLMESKAQQWTKTDPVLVVIHV